jgi:hypothetical protein
MIADRFGGTGLGLSALTRGQLALRLLVLIAPLGALGAGFGAAGEWSVWLVVVVLAGSVDCALRPESHVGLGLIVMLGVYWLAAVEDVRTPWTLVAAVAIALFHAAMAAASVAGPAGHWSGRPRCERDGVAASVRWCC